MKLNAQKTAIPDRHYSNRAAWAAARNRAERRVIIVLECLRKRQETPANLLGKSPEELRAFLQEMGEPAYRGAQIYHALYAERAIRLCAR